MFNRKKTDLQVAIDECTERVLTADTEPERNTHITNLERLMALQTSKSKPVSRDVLVTAGANLLGIVVIVGHERAHVIGSKALGLLMKMR